MKQSVVVVGLSRQAQFFGLPLPYAMAAMALTIIPFFILKVIPWLLTGLIWYGGARIITAINPNAHQVFATTARLTPSALLRRNKARRYV